MHRPASAGPICPRCELPGAHTDDDCLDALRRAIAQARDSRQPIIPAVVQPTPEPPARGVGLYIVWLGTHGPSRELRGRFASVADALAAGRHLRQRFGSVRLVIAKACRARSRWYVASADRPLIPADDGPASAL